MLSASLKILTPTFCLLLFALCFSSLPACKKPTEPKAVLPDTTSHDFVFELDTLGNGSSSVLNDVWIFDENNIWAVGEVYVQDSTGQAETTYNVARWDGKKWNLMQLYYPFNQTQLLIVPIRGIFAFSPNDIWLAAGSVFRWNGSSIQPFLLRPMILSGPETVEKLWGTSSSNLYGVGNAGTIVYYDGSNWQKLISGTTVDIQDIWGVFDVDTKQQTVLAMASHRAAVPQAKQLLHIQNGSVSSLSDCGLPFDLSNIWFTSAGKYFVVGDGVYHSINLDNCWQMDSSHPLIYKDAIRGTGSNDIFIVGSFGLVSHFNGASWKHYSEKETPSFYGKYKALRYSGTLMVAVGWLGERAVIIRGKRG